MEDLKDDWTSPHPRRRLDQGRLEELHPLSELPHPIIAKAADAYNHESGIDSFVGFINASTKVRLMEIKTGQWRGGVWRDQETRVHWLVVAGLAKGEHEDFDDFYQRIERANESSELDSWLPTDKDHRLLKCETAARLLTEWELAVQKQVSEVLEQVHAGGSQRIEIPHPIPTQPDLGTATIAVIPVRDDNYEADEIELEIEPLRGLEGSNLVWQMTIRALITICPPEQGWDRYKDTFSNIAEPGYLSQRIQTLKTMVAHNQLAESEPGKLAHFTHRQHLAGNTIEGNAVRALCGVFLVPRQDHESMGRCPECDRRFAELPS